MKGFRHGSVRSDEGFSDTGRGVGWTPWNPFPPEPQPLPPLPNVKASYFYAPTVTGTQHITGLGFRPLAIIFFGNASLPVGQSSAGGNTFMGFVALNPQQHLPQSSAAFSEYNGIYYRAAPDMSTTSAIRVNHCTTPGTLWDGTVVSMDADGFTIQWNVAFGSSMIISYIAIGDQITAANVVNWTAPIYAENTPVTVGFTPDLVIHISAPYTPNPRAGGYVRTGFNIGAMTRTHQWSSYIEMREYHAPAGWFLIKYPMCDQQVDTCCIQGSNYGSASDFGAGFVSMDTYGFTLGWDPPPTAPYTIASLCLKFSGAVTVGSFSKPASGAAQTQNISTGLNHAQGLLFVNNGSTGGFRTGVFQSIGAASNVGTAEWQLITTTGTYLKEADIYNCCIAQYSDGSADAAHPAGGSSGTFTIAWDAGTTKSPLFCYVALGT